MPRLARAERALGRTAGGAPGVSGLTGAPPAIGNRPSPCSLCTRASSRWNASRRPRRPLRAWAADHRTRLGPAGVSLSYISSLEVSQRADFSMISSHVSAAHATDPHGRMPKPALKPLLKPVQHYTRSRIKVYRYINTIIFLAPNRRRDLMYIQYNYIATI